MAVEAGVLFFVLGSGGPQASQASEQEHNLEPDGSQVTEEILVVEDKFQNLQTGRVWVWDASIFVQVKSKNKEKVEAVLKRRAASVKEGISQIFSRSQHAQLAEPERQTLNRQIRTFLDQLMEEEQHTVEPAGHAADDGHGGGGGHGEKKEAAAETKGHAAAAGGHGEEPGGLIQKVLIPKCRGFPTDF